MTMSEFSGELEPVLNPEDLFTSVASKEQLDKLAAIDDYCRTGENTFIQQLGRRHRFLYFKDQQKHLLGYSTAQGDENLIFEPLQLDGKSRADSTITQVRWEPSPPLAQKLKVYSQAGCLSLSDIFFGVASHVVNAEKANNFNVVMHDAIKDVVQLRVDQFLSSYERTVNRHQKRATVKRIGRQILASMTNVSMST
jgi:hypothetical protein